MASSARTTINASQLGATLRRRPPELRPPDPIDEALDVDRKLVAQKMMRTSVASMEAEQLAAENTRLKAQIENQQLKEAVERPAQGDAWSKLVMEELRESRAALDQTKQELQSERTGQIIERMNMLSAELERLRTQPQEPPPRAIVQLKAAFEEARETLALVAPDTTAPPVVQDAGGLYLKRLDYDQERWRETHQADREVALARAGNELTIAQLEIEIKQRRADNMDRFINETAPKLLDLGRQFLEQMWARPGAAAGEGAAPASMAVRPQVVIPPGAKGTPCPSCGALIIYDLTMTTVYCSNCASQHDVGPDEADEQKPAVEGESTAVEVAS